MQLSEPIDFYELYKQGVSAKNLTIAIVKTEFNRNFVNGLEWGAQKAFKLLANDDTSPCHVIKVPGVVELPLACQRIAQNKEIDAIVALGVVIRGDTSHFDYVCQMGSQGIMQAMLTTNKPIAFGVLTTDNSEQAKARCQEDDANKGIEAMVSAVKMCCINF